MSKRNLDFRIDDLESEFDYESEADRKKVRRSDFLEKDHPGEIRAPGRSESRNIFDEEHGKLDRKKRRWLSLDVYSRHKEMINQYYLYYPGATKRLQRDTSRDKTDLDVIREHHKFIWDESDEANTWERKLAKKYYDKLFKEYCLADLSKYRENKFALRWRVEDEVIKGKGQFICGNKKCPETTQLTSWEVNFAYIQDGQRRNNLVKVRLCPRCSKKLNFHNQKRKIDKKPVNSRVFLPDEPKQGVEFVKSDKKANISDDIPAFENVQKVEPFSEEQAKELWSKPAEIDVNSEENCRSRADEFEDFLDDMLL